MILTIFLFIIFLCMFVWHIDRVDKHMVTIINQQKMNQNANDQIIQLLEHIESNTHKGTSIKFPVK